MTPILGDSDAPQTARRRPVLASMTAMKAPTSESYCGHLWITVSLRRLVWTQPAALTSVAARLAQSSPG
jgi:hypothetical protein